MFIAYKKYPYNIIKNNSVIIELLLLIAISLRQHCPL